VAVVAAFRTGVVLSMHIPSRHRNVVDRDKAHVVLLFEDETSILIPPVSFCDTSGYCIPCLGFNCSIFGKPHPLYRLTDIRALACCLAMLPGFRIVSICTVKVLLWSFHEKLMGEVGPGFLIEGTQALKAVCVASLSLCSLWMPKAKVHDEDVLRISIVM
jgi:hypothetical protein